MRSRISLRGKYKIEVVHLGQRHKVFSWENESPERRAQILKSQYDQLRYLQENPDAIVFLEGWSYLEFISGRYYENILRDHARSRFPDGLPKSLEEFSEAQKQVLYEGGAETLYYLGLIQRPRPVGTRWEEVVERRLSREALFRTMSPGYAEWRQKNVIEFREQMTVRSVLRAIKSFRYRGQKIIIVYGRGHDFGKYFDEYEVDFSRIGN